jgi:hypothetical protein
VQLGAGNSPFSFQPFNDAFTTLLAASRFCSDAACV